MTFEQRFSKISDKFKAADTSILTKDFAIQVTMTNEDCGGIFYIANIGGTFSVEPYDYVDNTCAVTISAEDFMKVIGGRLNIDKAIAGERFAVYGNLDDFKVLPLLFPKAEKVKAPKAVAEKKEKTTKAKK